jgi:hypothetical protein
MRLSILYTQQDRRAATGWNECFLRASDLKHVSGPTRLRLVAQSGDAGGSGWSLEAVRCFTGAMLVLQVVSNTVRYENGGYNHERGRDGKESEASAMGLVDISFGLVAAPSIVVIVEEEVDRIAVSATVSVVVGGCLVRGMSEMNLMQRHTLRRTGLGGEVLRHCPLQDKRDHRDQH